MSTKLQGKALDVVISKIHALQNAKTSASLPGFGTEIIKRLKLVDVAIFNVDVLPDDSIRPRRDSKSKLVFEIEAQPDMLNGLGSVHGGCLALLLDVTSTFPIFTLGTPSSFHNGGVSSDFQLRFLSPAFKGDTLRITTSVVKQGKRTAVSDCLIENQKGEVLAVGTHGKASVSRPPSKL